MSVVSFGRVGAAVIAAFASLVFSTALAQQPYFETPEPAQPLSRSPVEEQSVGDLRALLLHTDRDFQVQGFEDALVATGKFGGLDIDQFNMLLEIPSLETLQAYDCVYAYTFFNGYARTAAGDRLKQYVDAGGGVILAPAAIGRTTTTQPLLGGITQPTYSPLNSTNVQMLTSPRNLDFATADVTDRLLEGVTEFSFGVAGPNFIAPSLDATADLVAVDNEARNLIAVSAQRDVVAINVFPGVTAAIPKSAGVFRTFANACSVVAILEVDIDVRPGNFVNQINLNSHAAIPVAIYGSEFLDVTEIDTSTLTFADAGVKVVGKKDKELCQIEDIDLDLYDDLICKFDAFDLGALDGASTEATVKGSLVSGRRFRGTDTVTILKE